MSDRSSGAGCPNHRRYKRPMARGSELDAVVDACRATIAGEELRLGDGALDWGRVVRLARFHRVQGLVWNAFARKRMAVPEEAAVPLAADAQAIAADNLSVAVESRDLLNAFQRAGIPVLFLKGLTLAALAYGSVSTKSSADIDILIAESDVGHTAALLSAIGYQLTVPRLAGADAALRSWHRHHKESVWVHHARGTQIDLHTRLADNPMLIPQVGMNSPSRDVEVAPAVILPTLEEDELFAYLCVHGSSSLWFRLKWVADFAAFIERKSGAELSRLYRRSQELGAARTSGEALLLADALFGSLEDAAELRAQLLKDRPAHRLFRAAVRQLAGRNEPREPTATPFGTAPIHYHQFLLAPGAAYKMAEALRHARLVLDRL